MGRILIFIKRIVRKFVCYLLFSPILKKTNWYKNLFVEDVYPSNVWYREHSERNFDLIALGSSGAKWAFDFSCCSIKAMNWAQQPQGLVEDYNLLRNFHSILRKDGVVIITIMPFTSINRQTGLLDALKYVNINAHEPIQPHLYNKAKRVADMPLLMGKAAFKTLIKYLLGKDVPLRTYSEAQVIFNPMTNLQLEQNALDFVNGWKKQFDIEDFDSPLTLENIKGREYRTNLMRTMVDFCLERGYRPVYIIPPVTKHLSNYFTSSFNETYIYSFLRDVDRNLLLLDYSKEENFQKDDLYFNSFFMNQKGRKMFTKRVLKDLNLIK